jgi:hypothetical protein
MRAIEGAIVLCVCVLTAAVAAADHWGAEGQRPTHGMSARSGVFSLAGFSEETTQGDVGLFELHRLCQERFGAMSRTCTMKEVQRSVRIPSLPDALAWLNSETYDSVTIEGRFADCAGWTGTTTTGSEGVGTVVGSEGRFQRASCSEYHPVACCSLGR